MITSRFPLGNVSFLTLSVSESAMYFIVGDTKITT